MPTPPDFPPPPQTAADLLAGLLRSQLFAESLFGQVSEQSQPYLDRSADEYAVALVEKKVLTPWQATELLAGRVGLYAGTFRLLERLATTADGTVFAAEQPGPQRLVMLQMTQTRIVEDSSAADSSSEVSLDRNFPRPPHFVRCIEVHQTSELQLVAYEFIEAKPLSELLAANPIERPHAAHLVRQFAAALAFLHDEALGTIGLPAAWIDLQGQLKLLAVPKSRVSELAQSQRSPQREALQLAAVSRFAAVLGGLPEMANCRFMIEVVQLLAEIAAPWAAPFAHASLSCPRVRMNRHLRRGPTRQLIETFGDELQVVLDKPGEEAGILSCLEERPVPTEVESGSAPLSLPRQRQPKRRAGAASIVLLLLITTIIATQWAKRGGVRPAEATTEEVKTSPTTGRGGPNPAPSRTGHPPAPQ